MVRNNAGEMSPGNVILTRIKCSIFDIHSIFSFNSMYSLSRCNPVEANKWFQNSIWTGRRTTKIFNDESIINPLLFRQFSFSLTFFNKILIVCNQYYNVFDFPNLNGKIEHACQLSKEHIVGNTVFKCRIRFKYTKCNRWNGHSHKWKWIE